MNWDKVGICVNELLDYDVLELDEGQKKAVIQAVKMLKTNGVIVADEVGLGKTRVALVIMEAVMRAGGTTAVLVPPGLMLQWKSQCDHLFEKLSDCRLRNNEILLRKYEDLFNKEIVKYPVLKEKWFIASHRFGFLEKNTDKNERYDLLSAIKYKMLKRHSSEWEIFYSKLRKRKRNVVEAAEYLCASTDVPESILWTDWQCPSGINSIQQHFFDIQSKKTNEKKNAELWLEFAQKCIGQLLGEVDLLVIDEAHRSRESDKKVRSTDETRLSQLTNVIIEKPSRKSSHRRLCMTATPIELRSSQWADIFARCGIENFPKTEADAFEKAVDDARINPKNSETLERLKKASLAFKEKMSSFVIRRRRIKQDSYIEKIKAIGESVDKLNPHIDYDNPCLIEPENFTGNLRAWKKAIFCYEGISQAAQGIKVSQKTKLQRCRYASGIMDIDDEMLSEIQNLNGEDCRKKRMLFWAKMANCLVKRGKVCNKLLAHPRVLYVANEIWEDLKKSKSKILVFGTYTKPIMALRDAINALYIIDCATSKPPKPTTRMGLSDEDIYEIYVQLKRGRLKIEELRAKVNKCEIKSKKYNAKLARKFSDEQICKKFDKIHFSSSEIKAVGERIRMELICCGQRMDNDAALNAICETYKESIKSEFEAGKKMMTTPKKRLLETLGLNKENKKVKVLRRGAFCRLMDGSVEMPLRNSLQQMFNNENLFPRVLIAQSTVGREGLNLQEACDTIYIFHPEWNPAVIDQEVGRIDRYGSLWEKRVKTCSRKSPKITVKFVIFKGTYDEHQYNVYKARKAMLDAHLSGYVLDMNKIPDDYKKDLLECAPVFDPA